MATLLCLVSLSLSAVAGDAPGPPATDPADPEPYVRPEPEFPLDSAPEDPPNPYEMDDEGPVHRPRPDYNDTDDSSDMGGYYGEVHPRHRGPCLGLNTYRDEWGVCQCVDGFRHGQPGSPFGCWNCDQTCHANGRCVHPGTCACQAQFRGDGVLSCEAVLPQIVAMAPIEVYTDEISTLVNISYLYDVTEWYSRSSAVCRFGDTLVSPLETTDTVMRCVAPQRTPQKVIVAVSFGGKYWSAENVELTYVNRFNFTVFIALVLLYAVIIAGVGAFIWVVCGRKKIKATDPQEKVPFLDRGKRSKGVSFARKGGQSKKRLGA